MFEGPLGMGVVRLRFGRHYYRLGKVSLILSEKMLWSGWGDIVIGIWEYHTRPL
jgi:hypothetical protein